MKNFNIYPKNFENWEFDKKASENFDLKRVTIAREQGASEDRNFEIKPTMSKPNFRSSLGINWEEQWSLFAEGFDNGIAHVDLNPYGTDQTVLLMPGAGFGDLSHPTTKLTLKMMAPYVKGKSLLDIGCGSGILSLAAIKMGATSAFGTDIDDFAIAHAKENAALNNLNKKVQFFKPTQLPKLPSDLVIVMNMISSEQQIAWETHRNLKFNHAFMITSGILKDEDHEYLALTSNWGWKLIQEQKDEEWKAYLFKVEQ
ncbi:MAG TPA: 50S ribosomal protein L11 methyltransferase [Rhabdochlamydiaceae bacterium]|nr:50S ribosomal protein L11 methyltransferase [Rhabdochlamydiaceae bacterium]